jgi:hypothetical protein
VNHRFSVFSHWENTIEHKSLADGSHCKLTLAFSTAWLKLNRSQSHISTIMAELSLPIPIERDLQLEKQQLEGIQQQE